MTVTGIGRFLSKGAVVATDVSYEITTSTTEHSASHLRGRGSVQGIGDISGRVLSALPRPLMGKPLELEMEDGRHWKCQLLHDGTLINSGGLTAA